jgi:hypothetical protein
MKKILLQSIPDAILFALLLAVLLVELADLAYAL